MESGRDSSFWRSLAVAFGDGLAFGVGMKLSQNTVRSRAQASLAPPAAAAVARLEQIEQRLERVERTPLPAVSNGGARVPVLDQKVLDAITGSLEARLKEHAVQVERRFTDVEAKVAVELQSLDHQDQSIAAGAQTLLDETRREFTDQFVAVGRRVEQEVAALHGQVVSLHREFAEAVARIVEQQVAAAVQKQTEGLQQALEVKAAEAARRAAAEGLPLVVASQLETIDRRAAATLEARMGEVERKVAAVLERRLAEIEQHAGQMVDARIAEVETRATAALDGRTEAIEQQVTAAIDARLAGHVTAALDARMAEVESQLAIAFDTRMQALEQQVAATVDARLTEATAQTEAALQAQLDRMEREFRRQLAAREAEIAELRHSQNESDRAAMEFVLEVSDLCRRAAERAAAVRPEPSPSTQDPPPIEIPAPEPASLAAIPEPPSPVLETAPARIEPQQSLSLDQPLPGFAQQRNGRSWRLPLVSSMLLVGCGAMLLHVI